MSRKVSLLICFVLVFCFGAIAVADDLEPPCFAGGPNTCAVLWEFDVEPPTATSYEYIPVIAEPCITYDYWIGDVTWDSGQQLVHLEDAEINWYASAPDANGAYVTLGAQTTYTGGELDVFPMLELWDAPRESDGEYLDGAEGPEDLDYYSAVEISPGVWHQTCEHTFEFPGQPFLVSILLVVTDEFGGVGVSDLKELVFDAIIHDGNIPCGAGQAIVSNESPEHEADHVNPNTNLSFQAPAMALCIDPNSDPNLKGPFEYDVWFGLEPNAATMKQLADDYSPTNCNDVMVFDPCGGGDLAVATVYYWKVDINDLNSPGTPQFYPQDDPNGRGIKYFRFRTWGFADNIGPANGATEVAPPVLLEWGPDGYATTCDVYFGTSFAEVNSADSTDTTGIYKGPNTVPDANYDAGMLDLSKSYYWRIDEVSGGGTAIKGEVWSFTTGSYFSLEDFDSYTNTPQLLDVWDDYWVNYSGAELYIATDANYTLDEDGNSMEYRYDSAWKDGPTCMGSVADTDTTSLGTGSDWTISGIRSILIHFMGTAGNSATANDRMWLELEDTSSNTGLVLYDGDINNLAVEDWHEWNIDLDVYDACGVSLENVDKIHLGFGGPAVGDCKAGGTGTVYFDEIELHPRRCRTDIAQPKGDLDADCVVDGYDLDEFSVYWLETEYAVPPVPPDDNMLELEYLFATDGNYNDTSGNSHHGQPSTTNTSVTGGVLHIEYDGAYVKIPFGTDNPFDGSADFSINIEYKASTPYSEGGILMSNCDPNGPNDPNLHSMSIFLWGETEGKAAGIRAAVYDNFWVGGAWAEAEIPDVAAWDAEWHDVAVTYDADGGICPDEPVDPNECPPGTPTGRITAYLDSDYLDSMDFDPNIPGIADDEVYIGLTLNTDFAEEDVGSAYFVGDINDVRVYNYALSHGEVAWLAGKTEPTCYGVYESANWVPSALGPCEDANNPDIINFLDYETLADNWLTGPWLWPDP